MSGNLKELTDATFDDAVKSGVVLVDFWAPWCGPCKAQTPILEEVAASIGDKAVIAKVNVDECQRVAAKFGIRSIPTLLLFKDGVVAQQMVGLHQAAQLVEVIESAS
ncbi:MAG: thioredoxin [Spartobacteria bacterium]|nr:thioredoxin [Spartobacteria bacterium]